MNSLTDIELVKLACGGDGAAFESLVNRHYTLVYRVAYKWCGIKENAEDITQEVFVKLAGKIKNFKGEADFKTWLYRVTVNTSKDLFKKNSRLLANEAAYLQEKKVAGQSNNVNDNPVSPEELYSALSHLSTKLKETVILVLGEGLSHKEAAMVLGCAETTVSWRVFKARGKLTKILAQEV
jgi:RNA polymerase sigma-70 factor (ECF subfamily)